MVNSHKMQDQTQVLLSVCQSPCLCFFLIPPRLGEKSAVERVPFPHPHELKASESHGGRYSVGSMTHALVLVVDIHSPPSGTGTFDWDPSPSPPVKTHVAFFLVFSSLSIFSLAKGYLTLGPREGRAREWDASAGLWWC